MLIKATKTIYHCVKEKYFVVEYFDPIRGVRRSAKEKHLEDAEAIALIEFKKAYKSCKVKTTEVDVGIPDVESKVI